MNNILPYRESLEKSGDRNGKTSPFSLDIKLKPSIIEL